MRKLRHTAYAYYFKKITIVGARLPRPYEVVLEKPSFQEKTRFRFVGVYTKNSCWLPQRVRQPTARSGECIARLLQNDHFAGP